MEGGRGGDAQDQGEAPQKPRQRQRERTVKTTFNLIIVLSCTDRLPCLRSIGELSPRHRRRGMRADRAVSLARDAVSLAVQGPLRTTRSALRCGKFLRLRTFLAHEKRVCGKHHSGRGQLFISKISPTDSSFPLQRRDLGVSLGSRHSAVGGGGGPRCNARAGLLAVRTVDRALTSSWDDGLWRGLPRKWRGHLVRLPRAFTALTLHHQVDRELAKYEARRLLYVNGLRSARR